MKKNIEKLLFVEDEQIWRETISEILSDHFSIDVAASYGEARAKLLNNSYDILILDPSLPSSPQPNFDSLRVLNDPRISIQAIPTVILTGNDSLKRTNAIFSKYSIEAFISKNNFDPKNFKNELVEIKERRKLQTRAKDSNEVQSSLWSNGLFFIFLLIVIILGVGWLAKSVSPIILAVAIAGSTVILLTIALLIFRKTRDLSEKNFKNLIEQIISTLSEMFKFRKQ